MKKFVQLKSDNSTHELHSRTARDAALKAASKNETQIILIEGDKLFIYEGTRRLLDENEQNSFTTSRQIKYKPFVKKLYYEKLPQVCNVKKEDDKLYIKEKLAEIGLHL